MMFEMLAVQEAFAKDIQKISRSSRFGASLGKAIVPKYKPFIYILTLFIYKI